ncbi:tRNA lysidine(34) synthetase TilS [Dehalobacter sp. DCM]|uniref:tRNA lysidine(34) synthetase TilS n=1 Tax=Dehalobacter sp. DCM TaxID=2907827 RepID=UPI003081C037|nr:tRNA lysidine(34) synthetase TilS [Dehalobacter sp. DCM]
MYHRLNSNVLPELIPPFSRVLVAVSGGPDSVALAHVIWRYASENKDKCISLIIVHVNHKVRKESEREAEQVRKLADQLGTEFILHEFDAKAYAYEKKKSFQEASREWRYTRFREDMHELDCNLLATAHHLGDQAETVLYRLLRGSGATGLAGIYPRKNSVVRPFLTVTKSEIVDYCHDNNLSYAIDQSNLKSDYCRNKIRLELIPVLEQEYNPRIIEALGRTAELLRWDEEYIRSHVDRLWTKYCLQAEEDRILLSLGAWDEPEAVLSRLLRRAAAEITGEFLGLEYKFIKNIIKEGKKTGWQQDLPGLGIENVADGFLFFRKELDLQYSHGDEGSGKLLPFSEIQLAENHWHSILGHGIQVGIFDFFPNDKIILADTTIDAIQLKELNESIICRRRRTGDRIYFQNLGHKTIKKVFQERNIPAAKRDTILLFAVQNHVIWIPGICRSSRFIPNKDSPVRYILIAQDDSSHSNLDSL